MALQLLKQQHEQRAHELAVTIQGVLDEGQPGTSGTASLVNLLLRLVQLHEAKLDRIASLQTEAAAAKRQSIAAEESAQAAATNCRMLQQQVGTLQQQLHAATASRQHAEQQHQQDVAAYRTALASVQQQVATCQQQAQQMKEQFSTAERDHKTFEVRADNLYQAALQRNRCLEQEAQRLQQQQQSSDRELQQVRLELQAVQHQLAQSQTDVAAALRRAHSAEAQLQAARAASAAAHPSAPATDCAWGASGSHQQQKSKYEQLTSWWHSRSQGPTAPQPHGTDQWQGTHAASAGTDTHPTQGRRHCGHDGQYSQMVSRLLDMQLEMAQSKVTRLESQVKQLNDALTAAQQRTQAAEVIMKQVEASGFGTWLARKEQADKEVAEQLDGKAFWALPGSVLILMWLNDDESAVVKSMHRLLSKACHPDKNQDDQDGHRKQQSINLAWDFLSSKM